jgi:hypothetical protein
MRMACKNVRSFVGLYVALCVVLFLVLLASGGCSQLVMRNPVPPELIESAEIEGIPDARYWGDVYDERLAKSVARSWIEERATLGSAEGVPLPISHDLAISGGGPDGAFGAGLLVGWTKEGSRPQFKIVTGVSTGALIAPFAFLGPRYDDTLRTLYTEISDNDIFKFRSLVAMIRGDSVADTTPLHRLTTRYITEAMLDEIAIEHRKGRRLLVGTTHLDAQRPVIWDMGAIAASGHANRLKIFRQALVASASIPAVFPPQYIPVQVGGKTYDEMHVDGGATRELFLYPVGLHLLELRRALGIDRDKVVVYILCNNTIAPQYTTVKPRVHHIAGRSISTLIKHQARGDLLAIYLAAQRDDVDFNLAAVPEQLELPSNSIFDPVYMKNLFAFGEGQALAGYRWSKIPPGLESTPLGDALLLGEQQRHRGE